MSNNYLKDLKSANLIEEIKNSKLLKQSPIASVIIVTCNHSILLLENLESLKKQTTRDFETIIVDNSENDRNVESVVSQYNANYIKLYKNYGPCLARNVGIKYSRGNIVIFLDDDAIPAHNFVAEHIRAHKKYDIFGLRGKSLPRTPIIYNYLESHYDYGNKTIPCFINLEGNSSFRRDVLVGIGGFNPKLHLAGGHEGLELTYRIIKKYKDKSKLIYYPNAVIYHDYSSNFIKYLKKALRHAKYRNKIKAQFKDIYKFFKEYNLVPENSKKDVSSFSLRLKITMINKITVFAVRVQRMINFFAEK